MIVASVLLMLHHWCIPSGWFCNSKDEAELQKRTLLYSTCDSTWSCLNHWATTGAGDGDGDGDGGGWGWPGRTRSSKLTNLFFTPDLWCSRPCSNLTWWRGGAGDDLAGAWRSQFGRELNKYKSKECSTFSVARPGNSKDEAEVCTLILLYLDCGLYLPRHQRRRKRASRRGPKGKAPNGKAPIPPQPTNPHPLR